MSAETSEFNNRMEETDLEYYPKQEFKEFDVYFLKHPIQYRFKVPARLKKSKYNYQITRIDDEDFVAISKVLHKLHPNLRLLSNQVYINSRKVKFLAEKGKEITPLATDKYWKLKIVIQGYKVNQKGVVSVVWKLSKAYIV